MEIHETYFQEWHGLSITPVMFKSGFVPVLTRMVFVQTQGCGSPGGPQSLPCLSGIVWG